MNRPEPVAPPSWEQAMWQAGHWLSKMEADSQRKLGDVPDMIRADAEAARAWIAYASELTNRFPSGPPVADQPPRYAPPPQR